MINSFNIVVFKYKKGEDNVIKVNGIAFQKCAPPADVEPLTTGNDVILLKTPGKRWYISGDGLHCDAGQKLAINVLEQGAAVTAPWMSPLPTPSAPLPNNSTNPPSPATKAAVSGIVMFAFTAVAGLMIMA